MNTVKNTNGNVKLTLISRLNDRALWRVVSNPRWDRNFQEGIAKKLLENSANLYVEYENCGCVRRVIRTEDLPKYVSED
jgi:hypothetical protein